MVHQRRMAVEAMKTRALLLAIMGEDSAHKAAEAYFRFAIPVSGETEEARRRRQTQKVLEWTEMDPIPLSSVRVPDYSPKRAKARVAGSFPEGRPGPPTRRRRR